MTQELQQFHFDDLCADLAMELTNNGARRFLMEFHQRYPLLYHEIRAQILRNNRQVPVLLKP